ncbi:dicarboxylate/amino acid:cation symporter [Sphingomonas prati]|uniref:Na+/H+-dicarboxylate symporter n=1 Tax=Sphingomonas prati TaxID=1843237 RepID=A0A7W9F2Z4_9SPHN|nr:dicarboxylate/amino acid:cation symporter [Sphingomonas prati]MBB5729319.1 Na+/H+-dicarboxylate symporter [Sphingomonas prati]GGE78379.1 sodium:proton antiporter [Sphingomonas prati]
MTATTTAPSRSPRFGFATQVLVGVLVGLALGFIARTLGGDAANPNWLMRALDLTGSIFVQLLRALVPPLVFTAIVASIANIRNLQGAAGLVWRTLLWFGITALIAVCIGLALGTILQPGVNSGLAPGTGTVPDTAGSWLDFLKGIIPSNPIGLTVSSHLDAGGAVVSSLSFNVLQIVVIALVIGTAAVRIGEKSDAFVAFNRAFLDIVRKILWWVTCLTPIGTAGLLGTAVAKYGWSTLAQLGAFAGAVYIGLAIVLFVVYPLILIANGLRPAAFFAGAWPAIQLGFVSRSSIGTLPVTEAVTISNLGVPQDYAAFAVPLAATTKMDGCAAIYPAIAGLFVAQFYGIPLHLSDYFLIAFVSVIGSAATAGLTGAIVMLTLTLSTLGLPLEGAGLLLAIDPIIDMGRTAVNVAGQALVPTIVAKRMGMLDQARYDSTTATGLPELA